MTDAEKDRLEWLWERARRMAANKRGHVYFSTCKNCGSAEWSSTHGEPRMECYGGDKKVNDDPNNILTVSEDINLYNDNHCRACVEVYHRTPEVALWVSGVMQWHIYLVTRKFEEQLEELKKELNNVRSNRRDDGQDPHPGAGGAGPEDQRGGD